jgi:hypothetical protein
MLSKCNLKFLIIFFNLNFFLENLAFWAKVSCNQSLQSLIFFKKFGRIREKLREFQAKLSNHRACGDEDFNEDFNEDFA